MSITIRFLITGQDGLAITGSDMPLRVRQPVLAPAQARQQARVQPVRVRQHRVQRVRVRVRVQLVKEIYYGGHTF